MNDKDKGIKITTVGDNPHVTFVQHIVTHWPFVLQLFRHYAAADMEDLESLILLGKMELRQ